MKKFQILLSFTIVYLSFSSTAYAVCPVCTVAVGAGLGLARYFGVDDTVSGVWVGGLILSSSFWFVDWLNKKNFHLPQFLTSHLSLITIVLMAAFVFLPLYFSKTIGHPFNTIFGIDKLIFGSIIGAVIFFLAVEMDRLVRKIKGHQLFIYQKVVFPFLSLAIISIAFYMLLKSI